MRVILDTNVRISGIFFKGPPSEILKAWRDGDIQFVLSPEIIDEYARVAKILASGFPGIDVEPILTLIIARSETIRIPPLPNQICEDPDDDKFVACALSGKTNIIISGDRHLLKISYQGIMVLTPREFVDRYVKK